MPGGWDSVAAALPSVRLCCHHCGTVEPLWPLQCMVLALSTSQSGFHPVGMGGWDAQPPGSAWVLAGEPVGPMGLCWGRLCPLTPHGLARRRRPPVISWGPRL